MNGLFYYSETQGQLSLPLVKVNVQASIKDLSASIQLEQHFHNETRQSLECAYTFPVPARAVVHSFTLVKQDGSRVVGIVQEKAQARETYETAVSEGKVASLLEQDTPDVFSVLVGNVLPDEKVQVHLTYATELSEDEKNDSVRLHIPAHIGQRYGITPPNHHPSHKDAVEFTVQVDIEAASPIRLVSSRTHGIELQLGPEALSGIVTDVPHSHFARATCTARSLEKDFVLTVQATGSDAPRCFAEQSDVTAAFALTLVPKFNLPAVAEQEYIFLVDRSGSMGGDRIDMARKALVVLLRSLPHKGTTFNVCSFGNEQSALFSNSVQYNQTSLENATSHVVDMEADYGGTEMRKALDETFKLRSTDRATSVFLLTDGDAWEVEAVYAAVKKSIGASPASAPLRVFVLGIGNSASTAMCEGIARHGNGAVQFVVDGESFTGKTARLLKAAKTPRLLNIRVEVPGLGSLTASEAATEDFEIVEPVTAAKQEVAEESETSTSLFDESIDPLADSGPQDFEKPAPVNLPPPPALQLVPYPIANLYPGTRMTVYGILQQKPTLPRAVKLLAELASGQPIELSIPVVLGHLQASCKPIHALAAKKLIQDLEDGRRDDLSQIKDHFERERTVKAEIVRLGTTYGIASSHTSFVAVDESEVDARRKASAPIHPRPRRSVGRSSFVPASLRGGGLPGGGTTRGAMKLMRAAAPGSAYGAPAPMASFEAVPGGAHASNFGGAQALGMPGAAQPMMNMMAAAPAPRSVHHASSLYAIPPPPPSMSWGASPSASLPATQMTTQASVQPQTVIDMMDTIARKQRFDGSFEVDVLATLGLEIGSTVKVLGVPDGVAATVAVLIFWNDKESGRREEWEDMADKAVEWVESQGHDVRALMTKFRDAGLLK